MEPYDLARHALFSSIPIDRLSQQQEYHIAFLVVGCPVLGCLITLYLSTQFRASCTAALSTPV